MTLQKALQSAVYIILLSFTTFVMAENAQAKGAKMSISIESNEGSFGMTIYSTDNKMRIEAGDATSKNSFIVRDDSKKIIFLVDEEKQYMEMPLMGFNFPNEGEEISKEEATEGLPPFLKPTGKKKNILGFPCEQYMVKEDGMTGEMWLTKRPNIFYRLSRNPMLSGFMSIGMISETAMFPMLISLKSKDGDVYKVEVKELKNEAQPASLFEPPKGYTKLDMSGMMGQ